jgi:hypothetical protein
VSKEALKQTLPLTEILMTFLSEEREFEIRASGRYPFTMNMKTNLEQSLGKGKMLGSRKSNSYLSSLSRSA